ncbi:flavin-containing monooxygenase 5 isoform X1 [Pteronotus mesoamericanus]|uniref:flavin-containing monooxygenase 5 isoform X1 n=1 Tax=Pteronotus mesoamericanus TaxID=1884717 RepID=UPI0023EDCB5F|nr:flavin-containing monooxygenase 5 isoform X1 [Pteronotus parnellii mesoamericanus]XP_054419259.1 flavin-containing monooxygenase 5 isoform X1 [Pteronotus parnellii mesoamericanus]XP_054419260.1 flavin-containing monooxygenase 5 isoform X1 [Pteronotus parnellii mesoamericanus]XP_054419261.1 flavin-containing monooxygenase 5 isoform X1 [Pteronotus parnellii mesoamericanus]
MTNKRIAVIGGGASGLTSIKCCLEEGLQPICFERTDDIGGLWRFQENPEEGRASIYKSVVINTSKEMMCFSDYPIPDHFPNFMHNSRVLEYFRMYAKEFDLLKYIKFKTTVCSVKKQPDFSTSGQWEVVTESEGRREVNVFDGVMVCTGHHTNAHLPLESFPGIETFKGQYFHSRDYKSPERFTGKRVIIIGIGNSGGDLAVEISHVAKQVFLSTRRGAWIINRVADHGYPNDVLFLSRFNYFVGKICGQSLMNTYLEKKMNQRFNHEMYGLKPKHRALSQHPTLNDVLPNRLISGLVKVKGNVKEFTETAAIFEDGSREDDIDAVIFATGYSFAFPFLEDSVKVVKNKISLYKKVFPPNLEKPTLAIIGLIQPWGAIMPISELQGRWVTQVFKGVKTLPSQSEMITEITKDQEKMEKRWSPTRPAVMGNTTSDRVAGERHGAKAARAEGASGHGLDKEHKIMVGSTDDPSLFNLPDSKLPGDKEFVSWQQELEDSVKPTQQARPTVIRWSEGGKEVFISGSFNNWSTKIPLIKSHNDFVAILDLPEGEHQYKFFVDGQWVHDPSEPVVTSQLGTINNLIHVKKSDFEVFDALKLDSMESSETSCRDLSSSPPGPYGQEMYMFRSEERFKSPPILPPHLLQVILNKDTNISCDPALLPEPNHVMLNHLYALSIKIKKIKLREVQIAILNPVIKFEMRKRVKCETDTSSAPTKSGTMPDILV